MSLIYAYAPTSLEDAKDKVKTAATVLREAAATLESVSNNIPDTFFVRKVTHPEAYAYAKQDYEQALTLYVQAQADLDKYLKAARNQMLNIEPVAE